MPHPPFSVRISDRAYAIYEAEAAARGQRPGQVIRAAIEREALALRRARIRAESERVAERYRTDPEVRRFYDEVSATGGEAVAAILTASETRDLVHG